MPRKKIDVLEVAEAEVPMFSSGAVCEILQITPSRLHNLLRYHGYDFTKIGRKGTGQGSRHFFRVEDIYRFGVALLLLGDGFAPQFVGEVLQTVEDTDFIDFDENGMIPPSVIAFRRGDSARRFEVVSRKRTPCVGLGTSVYYLLDIEPVVRHIDGEIAKLEAARRRNSQ